MEAAAHQRTPQETPGHDAARRVTRSCLDRSGPVFCRCRATAVTMAELSQAARGSRSLLGTLAKD